jgi:hypothetical protein
MNEQQQEPVRKCNLCGLDLYSYEAGTLCDQCFWEATDPYGFDEPEYGFGIQEYDEDEP